MTNREKSPPRLLRVRDAADQLNLGINRTYRLVASGDIYSIRIGNTIRVPEDAIDKFIASRQTEAA
jgi:excisionase family DNA binding protein